MSKKNRNILIFFAGVLTAFFLMFAYRKNEEVITTDTGNLLEDVEAEEVETVGELPDRFLRGNANFSIDLFKEVSEEKNAVFSPVPVYLSLGLLANGADDQAQAEILETLNLADLKPGEFNPYYHELMRRFESEELNLANSIWYDQDFQADADFLKTNKMYYDASSYVLDFSDSKASTVMNDWVSDATDGKIDQMVDEISAETVMYLFSIIYFDATWEVPFIAEKTYASDFLVDGETVEVDKMTARMEIEHLITEEEEGIILPYEGSQYSFVALMPAEGVPVRNYLQSLTPMKLTEIVSQIKKDEVEILLPKFKVSFENKLNAILPELGVQAIFDPQINSLSRMGQASDNLFVSEMFQKTVFEVDELGTEAASAVGSTIEMTSLPEPKPIIDFNRPFIYSILDNETGLPVFLGIIDQPEK